jgi:hypothetical protein
MPEVPRLGLWWGVIFNQGKRFRNNLYVGDWRFARIQSGTYVGLSGHLGGLDCASRTDSGRVNHDNYPRTL